MRLLICSPVAIYAEGLAVALGRAPGIRVLGTVADAPDCLEEVERVDPDVLLLDLATTGALPLIGDLVVVSPRLNIVVLAVPETESVVVSCAEAGVAGYVTRDDTLDDLLAAVLAVQRDEVRCSPRTAAILLRRVRAQAGAGGSGHHCAGLTTREAEVLQLMAEGLSNKEIAMRLFIELPTVKNHVHHILEKTDARGRAEAVAWMHSPAGRREIRIQQPSR